MVASAKNRRAPARSEPPSKITGGRSLWTGQLRLALVTIPVQLVSAIASGERLSFHQIDAKSHKRIRYEKIAPGVGRVDADDIVKGFELSKGNYVLITDEDLDQVKLEAKRTIDLVQFVDHCEIDPIYFDKPYFVVANDKLANEAYAVLREAMRATGKMGIGQFVMRGREYIAALKPYGDGLLLETLRFADEVRTATPFFRDVDETAPAPELLDMARDLIKRKTKAFDANLFHDHYTEALRALIEAKAKNKVVVDEAPADAGGERGNVIDLVEALRQSVRASQPGEAPPAKKKRAK
ncbi:Ku protein [Acidocella sp.]|jgi:DNA end-binding protein Ku|uniref:non-homologous end joining protein Ku n=1 Tax=Acidocella sp. TaxID=50710 RepID=UPI002F3F79A5